jgi:ATP-dependent helicase/nuclease subunit B
VHALKIKERDDGSVSVLSVGNLMHEILRTFVLRIKEVNDKESSDALFESIKNKVLERNEYKKFLSDAANFSTVQRVMKECKGYCYKTFKMLEESAFSKSSTEVSFGDGGDYPAISLLDGKVKLKGKIDRVDENEEYFRVVDYKTGATDASSKALFSGVKLQLYLYAAAVQGASAGSKKTPAGLYYLPISDKYEKQADKGAPLAVGKTLSNANALSVQYKPYLANGTNDFPLVGMDLKTNKIKNSADEKTIQAHVDYALKISELAAKRMSEGYVKASPYDNACERCEFLALCEQKDVNPRTLNKITDKTVTDAVDKKEDADGAN